MKKISLKTPIKDLFMVGETYAKRLLKLEIKTVEDLLHHYPARYEDYSLISRISQAQPGETVTIQGKVVSFQNVYTKKGKKIQKAVVQDLSGQINVIWFNQPFLTNTIKKNVQISLSGTVSFFDFTKALVSPEYEILKTNSNTVHTGRLVPIYPETYGVSSKWLRSRIAPVLLSLSDNICDWLPMEILNSEKLIDLKSALNQIHFPQNQAVILDARKRLAFDELFLIQLASLKRKKSWQKNKSSQNININKTKLKIFINNLPFKLTSAQKKATQEILADLKQLKPMNRLLEGDVGSGKTVVATIAMYATFLNRSKSALMAPTEILAQQHFQEITKLLKPFKVKIALVTSATKKPKPNNINTKHDIYVGTHALIYDRVNVSNLALVVIDEQHRFGVEQRAKLIKRGKAPHVLTMTATPIPRTIALTLFGDLDLSVLDQMPKGRKDIKTWVVPMEKRQAAYEWIKKQVKKNNSQVFIVYPLIEESDKESMNNIKAAKAEFKHLESKVFPNLKLGLLHGKIKSQAKQKVLDKFKNKKLNILVSTPVVEVGIDIPNATIMMIEAAERFGLAQLHQLRGRVGRSDKQSYCLLFTTSKDREKIKRLWAMQQFNSGFKLAEIDLKIRGPGEIYGTRQHGFTKLKIASYNDRVLVNKTRNQALKYFEKMVKFPLLKQKLKSYTMNLVKPN